jgi:hypothetical protein
MLCYVQFSIVLFDHAVEEHSCSVHDPTCMQVWPLGIQDRGELASGAPKGVQSQPSSCPCTDIMTSRNKNAAVLRQSSVICERCLMRACGVS